MQFLYLKEEEIEQLVTVKETIDLLDKLFLEQAASRAFTNSRERLRMPGATLHLMAGAMPGYFGFKAYTSARGKTQFFFFLYSAQSSELVAMMEANRLGQIRTGAATGLATRLLANPNANEAALFGCGWQAQTQLVAMDAVRNLKRVWIINRDPERRRAFITAMQPRVKAELIAATSAEDAVRRSQIVTTITNSRDPVVNGEWLTAGTHINAAGGNRLLRREVDDETVLRCNRVVVDSVEQAKIEAGEFLGVIQSGRRHWQEFIELRELVANPKIGRENPTDITLFKSLGVAIEDVAVSKLVYEKAKGGRSLNQRIL